jgi:hypothetical protein
MSDDDDWLMRRIAERVRDIAPPAPALDARIMAEVRHAARPRWRRAAAWLVAPMHFRLSPAGALAAAATVALAVALGLRGSGTPEPATAASHEVATVRFELVAPEAASVAVVGDFNAWSRTASPLAPGDRPGVWTVEVPLSAGRHEYAFVVDGVRWLPDPRAPRAVVADFDVPNSVVTVTPGAL